MNRNQAAGHLGAANNPTVSAEAKHYSRQQLISAGHQSSSGISKQKIAGMIGATTNPQLSQQSKHEARKFVMDAVCPGDRSSQTSKCSSQTSRCSSQTSRSSSRTSNCSSQTPCGQDGHYVDSDHPESDDDYSDY